MSGWKWDAKHIIGVLAVVWAALVNAGVVPPIHSPPAVTNAR